MSYVKAMIIIVQEADGQVTHLLLEMVVDEGDSDTNLGPADDVGHVLGLVLHVQGDDVTSLQLMRYFYECKQVKLFYSCDVISFIKPCMFTLQP